MAKQAPPLHRSAEPFAGGIRQLPVHRIRGPCRAPTRNGFLATLAGRLMVCGRAPQNAPSTPQQRQNRAGSLPWPGSRAIRREGNVMARKTALLFALGVLGCCGALNGSALAQVQPMPPMRELPPPPAQARQMQSERGLPFEDVIALVRSMDLDPVTAPIRRGARYVVRAVDQYGNMVRVVVDGQLARVVALRPVMGRARSVEYAPPTDYPPRVVYGPSPYGPPAESRAPARWGDNYVPEYGEVPPPRADVPSASICPVAASRSRSAGPAVGRRQGPRRRPGRASSMRIRTTAARRHFRRSGYTPPCRTLP